MPPTPEPQRGQRGAPAARSARTNDVDAVKARRTVSGPGSGWSSWLLPGAAGLEPADFAVAAAGDGSDQLALVVNDPQAGVTQLDSDELACVRETGLDALAGDLDAAQRLPSSRRSSIEPRKITVKSALRASHAMAQAPLLTLIFPGSIGAYRVAGINLDN